MILFLLDIIIISVLVLSFAAIVFLYINPTYNINSFKKKINKTCKSTHSINEEEEYVKDVKDVKDKEVYNIGRNVYKYEDAKNVCKEFDGELATEEQLSNAFSKGANWCNYGWVKGQKALFPIQSSFYAKLQDEEHLNRACGNIGLNGGYFKDTNLKFGVNCYGVKPENDDKDNDYSKIIDMVIPRERQALDDDDNKSNILHFNHTKWSMHKKD